MDAVKAHLDYYRLSDELASGHRRHTATVLHELTAFSNQLKSVGGNKNKNKLTIQFQDLWDKTRADMAVLGHEVAELADKEGPKAVRSMLYHDPLTLLRGKNFLGAIYNILQLSSESGDVEVRFASADLDNFKTVNDCWSHAHGDQAIILGCQAVQGAIGEHQPKGCICVPFRFGGDEIVLALISERGTSWSTWEPMMSEIRKAVNHSLKIFDFSSLKPRPADRKGKPIEASSPSISIGVSGPVVCHKGVETVQLHAKLLQADDVLNHFKDEWKKNPWSGASDGLGGGVAFHEEALESKAKGAEGHVRKLQTGSSGEKEAAKLEKEVKVDTRNMIEDGASVDDNSYSVDTRNMIEDGASVDDNSYSVSGDPTRIKMEDVLARRVLGFPE